MRSQRGMTLIEVLFAVGIVGLLIVTSMTLTNMALRQTQQNSDKQFATQKAMTILEELRSIAQGSAQTIVVLDEYNDGVTNTYPVLTSDKSVTDPSHVTSGNIRSGSRWVYHRQIVIERLPGQSSNGVRLVRVRILKEEKKEKRIIAEVASVLRTVSQVMQPSQVYDVYAVAIENVPGWWTYAAQLLPLVQNAVDDLEARNPGLVFRVHWITELSYGRNPQYKPYINSDKDADEDINSVYFYPGTLKQDAARNPPLLSEYYPQGRFRARMSRDADEINGYDNFTNPAPYSLADNYNHSLRYEEEAALAKARFDAGTETEQYVPTLRLLIDDMVLNPARYTNAILINLHGELLPFPPVRNYADPAKDPEQVSAPNLEGVRVVTHPEQLTYDRNDPVRLRVYGWYSYLAPDGLGAKGATDQNQILERPITVLIKNMQIAQAHISVEGIRGGVDGDDNGVIDKYLLFAPATADPGQRQMWSPAVQIIGNDTLVTLHRTPLTAPVAECSGIAGSTCGLPATRLLYGMEYVPSPVENLRVANPETVQFTRNLGGADGVNGPYNHATAPKNTARWIIRIDKLAFSATDTDDRRVKVETRIGTDLTTGIMFPAPNKPENISTTYFWRGEDDWLYGNAAGTKLPNLPITERYQFLGDPRHCPYADLKRPARYLIEPQTGEHKLGMGYNRYFDNFGTEAGANEWDGYNYSVTLPALLPTNISDYRDYGVKRGWETPLAAVGNYGLVTEGSETTRFETPEVDVPRMFQMLRTALTSSRAIYTTMTGFSYYYFGLGGEIGYDRDNTFDAGVPLSTKPFSGAAGTGREQSITNDRNWSENAECADPAFAAGTSLMVGGTSSTNGFKGGCGVKYVRDARNGTADYWWGINWLGELYPDSQYATWKATGNLPTGTGSTNFVRSARQRIRPQGYAGGVRGFPLPTGTTFRQATRRSLSQGSISFVYGVPYDAAIPAAGTATYSHVPQGNATQATPTLCGGATALGAHVQTREKDLTSPCATLKINKGYAVPLLDPIEVGRPWSLSEDRNADTPPNFGQQTYSQTYLAGATPVGAKAYWWMSQTGILGQFYADRIVGGYVASARHGSALMSMRDPITNNPSFVVVNGLSPAGSIGQSFIARWSFITLIHGFLQSGLYGTAGYPDSGCAACALKNIKQLPRIKILYPDENVDLDKVTKIDVKWSKTWKRWDDAKYTGAYADAFADNTANLSYYLMYSRDNGQTWKYPQDETVPCIPGKKTTNAGVRIAPTSQASPEETFTLNTPAGTFPAGTYIIRVEAYRDDRALHYSYHEFPAYIRR